MPEPRMLISVTELAGQLEHADLRVIDCRFDITRPTVGPLEYRAGHVPGALYADLDRDLAAAPTPGSGRHPLPEPAALTALYSRWGIGPGTRVVAYDGSGGAVAARLWWLLRWMGHDSVALLDGGWQAWLAAGLPVSSAVPEPAPVRFEGSPGHMPVIETDEIQRRLGDPRFVLLDARAPERFRGEVEPIDRVAGHVPGARNHPFQRNLTPDGRFRSPSALREQFAAWQAAAETGQLAAMCGSGVTACHNLFALSLAGLSGARLYAGSWSGWIASGTRPVAVGDEVGACQLPTGGHSD
jgi:thiosulfate/3-mercaptopyruvate sulfurtransferase